MATYDQILANIVVAVPELTSTSNVATYKKIAEAIAISLDETSAEIVSSEAIIQAIIDDKNYGRSGYYIAKALAYQEGDSLVINSETLAYEYAVIDTTKQIIKQAAFEVDVYNNLILKVAKLDSGTGLLAPLTAAEKTAFDSYMLNFEIPGLPLTKVSLSPNVLNFSAQIFYYTTYDLTTLITNILAAVDEFRNEFPFDGVFYANDLEDYIKTNVGGIRNFSMSAVTLDGSPIVIPQPLSAGYFNYNAAVYTMLGLASNYTAV